MHVTKEALHLNSLTHMFLYQVFGIKGKARREQREHIFKNEYIIIWKECFCSLNTFL